MSKNNNSYNKQDGFSLWELSLVMLIMIGLFVALINIMPMIIKRDNVEFDNSIVIKVDEQILGFIATYNRLPCPATSSSNGVEDCGSTSGSILPYKTLGLNEDYAGVGSIPLKYAVFRNTVAFADLTTITDLFNPTDSHGTVTTLNQINGLDFCTALTNARNSSSPVNTNFAHIVLPNGTMAAVPYVVVTAGIDGNFDGKNANGTMDFEAPNKNHDANYDDTVFSKNFDELASTLSCDTAQNSLNLLADAKATHTENVTQQQSIKEGAELAIIITIMQTALGVANTAMAVYNLVLAVIEVVAAGVNLAAAIAACIASLGTACGLVAKAIAALVLGVAAVVAAGVAVAANIAALVVQVIAVVKIIDVANRAGSTVAVPDPNTATDAMGNTTTNSDLAVQTRAQADKLKKEASEKVINARNSISNARGLAVSVRNRFNVLKGQTQALADTNAAINDATFSTYSNAANSQTQTNINQANNAINGLNGALGDANNAVTAVGTPLSTIDPSNPFGPPIITYPNANLPLAKTHLELAEPQTTTAGNNFTNLSNSYLNTKTHATTARDRIITLKTAQGARPVPVDIFNPTAAEIAAINAWDARRADLDDAQNKAQAVINRVDELFLSNPFDPDFGKNIFATWIGRELGLVLAADGNTQEAFENITAALDADANATYMENNIGVGNPGATTNVLNLSLGVDAILLEADKRGVEQQ